MKTLSSSLVFSLLLVGCGEQEFFVTINAELAPNGPTPLPFQKIVIDVVPLSSDAPLGQIEILATADNDGEEITLPTSYALSFPKELEGQQYKLIQRAFTAESAGLETFSAETFVTVGGNNTERATYQFGSALALGCENGVAAADEFCVTATGQRALPSAPKLVEHFPIEIPNREEFWVVTDGNDLIRLLTDGANLFNGEPEAPIPFSVEQMVFGDFQGNPPLEAVFLHETEPNLLLVEPAFVNQQTSVSLPKRAVAAAALDADRKAFTDLAVLTRDSLFLYLPDAASGLASGVAADELPIQTAGCTGKNVLALQNPQSGHQDILYTCVVDFGVSSIEVLLGNGDGLFLNSQQKILAAGVVKFLLPMDVDSDGDNDLIVFLEKKTGTTLQVLLRGETGLLSSLSEVESPFQVTAAETGDLNGDGSNELLFGTADGKIFVFASGNDSALRPVLTGFLQNTIRSIAVLGDANGDGLAEVVIGRNPNEVVLFSSVP